MKFIGLYLLTFIIARENCVEGGGELSENDLHFIADRLYPEECSRLLSYLPGSRGTSRRRVTAHHGYRDEWITENSRIQCLESLDECNQRGKTIGCTKNWLEAALHEMGRADLASRLKKRRKTKKAKRKNTRRKPKTPRSGRSDKEPRRNYKHYSKNKTVKSHVRGAKKKDLFERRFMIFVVAGSILLLVSLGCVLIVSYRRACRCYKDYLRLNYDERDEKPYSFEKSNSVELHTTRGRTTSGAHEIDERNGEYTKFVLVSDNEKKDDLLLSDDDDGPLNIGKTKNVSFDSANETDDNGCNCDSVEAQSKRTMSPCARIKRFFNSQKRHVCREEDTLRTRNHGRRVSGRMKIGKSSIERTVTKKSIGRGDSATGKYKNDRKKTVKYAGGRGKVASRKRRAKAVKSNRKDIGASRPSGCICEMCKLLNVTGEGACNERGMEQRRMTRSRKR